MLGPYWEVRDFQYNMGSRLTSSLWEMFFVFVFVFFYEPRAVWYPLGVGIPRHCRNSHCENKGNLMHCRLAPVHGGKVAWVHSGGRIWVEAGRLGMGHL